jgi:hypothetical protein
MLKLFVRALAVLVPATLLIAPTTQAAGQASLSDVRQATAKYHSVQAAQHAGYQKFLPCFDYPGVGGMGQHYVNFGLLNGSVDANQPQAMVYEVNGDRLQLVAVEYIVPGNLAQPTLFGRPFFWVDSLQIWALHAWIWRPNPDGIFASYNPSVKLCPGH